MSRRKREDALWRFWCCFPASTKIESTRRDQHLGNVSLSIKMQPKDILNRIYQPIVKEFGVRKLNSRAERMRYREVGQIRENGCRSLSLKIWRRGSEKGMSKGKDDRRGGWLIKEKRERTSQREEKLVLPAEGRRAERLSGWFPPARPEASTVFPLPSNLS